jgi:septal ring factor EnvC (AmiA/AmiB activator)
MTSPGSRAGARIGRALLCVAGLALAAPAHAGLASEAEPSAAADPAPASGDPLADQLAAETASVGRAIAQVDAKLAAAERTRRDRLRAAVRLLGPAPGDDAVTIARRRAAARLLVDRDARERGLLVDELAQLRAARDRIALEVHQLAAVVLPRDLALPARGKIARHFGVLAHERSRTTLSRRGIDLEVDDHAAVTAPAAGTVRYAGPIRGLDQGVILDHGGYLTVIGKLGELALPVGAPIAAGDRLGRAARHRVYFEVRVKLGPGGLPVDPEPLLARAR